MGVARPEGAWPVRPASAVCDTAGTDTANGEDGTDTCNAETRVSCNFSEPENRPTTCPSDVLPY